MGWHFVLHLYRDGDEPPACTRGNDGAHDLTLKAERFGHIDSHKLGDTYRLPIDSKFIVGQIEAQSIPFLAFETRKATFLPILAQMLKLWKCPFLLHPPVVVKGLPKIAK